jgi:beta-mannosidase
MKHKTLDLRALANRHGPDNVYLRLALESGGAVVSENTVFLAPPRFLSLPRPVTRVTVHGCGPRRVRLAFRSAVFQHALAFELTGLAYRATDNFFDLYPDEVREVEVELPRALPLEHLRKKLTWRSLADTYA